MSDDWWPNMYPPAG